MYNWGGVMYKIAICDDENIIAKYNEKIVKEVLCRNNIHYEIDVFSKVIDLINKFEEDKNKYDLLLLDILLDEDNGVELGRKLRKMGVKSSIIFITTSVEFAIEGYDVEAIKYIIKPISCESIENVILRDYRSNRKFCLIKNKSETVAIKLSDIYYIESMNKDFVIHYKDSSNVYSGKLSDIKEKVGNMDFVQVHRCYLINLRYINEIKRNEIVLKNKKIIPLSKSRYKEIQMQFMEWISMH